MFGKSKFTILEPVATLERYGRRLFPHDHLCLAEMNPSQVSR